MNALWYPAASVITGPERKTSGTRSASVVQAAVYHSVEGSFAAMMGVLGNPAIDSSWHLSNPVEGEMQQHYSLDLVAWHAKGHNTPTIGVENEGSAGEPLSLSQTENLAAFSAWLVDEGWLAGLQRPTVAIHAANATLLEHNEVGRYIADPPYTTACPSDRIPWQAVVEGGEEIMSNQAAMNEVFIASANQQQAQIDGLMGLMAASAHTHAGGPTGTTESPDLAALQALAEENRARLEALGAAASGE